MGWDPLRNQLADTFLTNGIFSTRLHQIIESEQEYCKFIESNYGGHIVLADSFQEFYIETIELAASVWKSGENDPCPPGYSECFLWHLGNLRSIRSIDILFYKGYSMDGFARLRYLKESAIFLAAILSGETTYFKIKGSDGVIVPEKKIVAEDMENIRKNSMKEERRILNLMLRGKSGLDKADISQLKKWESFFHKEVHGGMLTQVFEYGDAMRGEDTLSIAPKPKEASVNMLMNRFSEVGWMLHRTLPIMQLSSRKFDSVWREKWKLLDQNFRLVSQGLADMEKDIGSTFIRFIDVKFPFNEEACFKRASCEF